jgi:hypothetical protein
MPGIAGRRRHAGENVGGSAAGPNPGRTSFSGEVSPRPFPDAYCTIT